MNTKHDNLLEEEDITKKHSSYISKDDKVLGGCM